MPNLIAKEHYVPTEPVIVDKSNYNSEENLKRKPFVSEEHIQKEFGVEESRKMLYDNVQFNGLNHNTEGICFYENGVKRQVQSAQLVKPPQPILPPKPKSRESVEREITMR